MQHPGLRGRAMFAAALSALLAIMPARSAAADAGGFALLRVFGDGGAGSTPAPAASAAVEPTPELAAWAGSPAPANLPTLLTTAIQQTPNLASAKIDIAIAEARMVEASGVDDWQIAADAKGSHSTSSFGGLTTERVTAATFGADLIKSLSTGGSLSLHAGTSYTKTHSDLGVTTEWADEVTLTATQPILRGRGRAIARSAIARAVLARDAATLAQRQVAITAVQGVISAYWDLALSERVLAIRRAGQDLIRERRRLTELGITGGKVAPSELLAVDQAVATQEEQILTAEVGVVQSSIAVRRAAGMPIAPGAIALSSGADASAPARTATLDDSLRRALASSPELAQLGVQDKDAVIEVEVAENGLLPQLDAALTLGPTGRDNRPSQAIANMAKFDEFTIVGSLSFQYELGHHAATGATRAARLAREKIQVNATDVKAQIAQAVAEEVATLELASRRVGLAQTAIDLAKKNIDVEQSRFSLGKSTNFDVLQRQNELQQAELSKAQAEIDARKAEASLSALTGDILEEYGITLDAKRASR